MSAQPDTVRVFVSVGLSIAAREQLIDAVARIQQDVPDGIQWAHPDGMHLTLKFLGNISAMGVEPLLKCVEEFAAETPSLSLSLFGLGIFPNRRAPRVLWAGVAGHLDSLSKLQHATEKAISALGYPAEHRPFRPHITFGRPRRTISDAQRQRIGTVVSALDLPNPVSWRVGSVEVMRSEMLPTGARYTVLGSAPLKPSVHPGE